MICTGYTFPVSGLSPELVDNITAQMSVSEEFKVINVVGGDTYEVTSGTKSNDLILIPISSKGGISLSNSANSMWKTENARLRNILKGNDLSFKIASFSHAKNNSSSSSLSKQRIKFLEKENQALKLQLSNIREYC